MHIMLCVYSLASCLRGAAHTFIKGEEKDPEINDGRVNEALRQNPLVTSLSSGHWSWRLTCGVCLEYFKDPVILPCGHTFCHRCLVSLIDHERRRRRCIAIENLRVRCPECRHIIRVQTLRNRFVHNITAASILEGWLEDFTSHSSVDKAIQVNPAQVSSSTQTTEEFPPASQKVQSTSSWSGTLPSLFKRQATHKDTKRCTNISKERGSQTGTMDETSSWQHKDHLIHFSCVDARMGPSLNESNIERSSRHATSTCSYIDYWGMYRNASYFMFQPSSSSWISPQSVISNYGWYVNHFLFAFFLFMCCTGKKF